MLVMLRYKICILYFIFLLFSYFLLLSLIINLSSMVLWLQDHPKDVEHLNTPIRFCDEMETIFGSSTATGRFAFGSNEPLGVNCNTTNTAAGKMEGTFGH